ncbi:MAG: CDP-archaeol synthase [Candidatus Woesearchaeota archaeon]|nr:CDP-archaeol synthase [Candidatus Woesearchaeota archaeon]
MQIIINLLLLLYFMLPAYVANMMPVLMKKVPLFDIPVDNNALLCGKPVFGQNKTWRGLVFGVLAGVVVGFLQSLFGFSIIHNFVQFWFPISVLLSAGALFGDLVKSFLKRRMGISPGNSWLVFDQLDYVIGALLFVSPFFWPGIGATVILLIFSGAGHVLVNHIGFWLGMQKTKW